MQASIPGGGGGGVALYQYLYHAYARHLLMQEGRLEGISISIIMKTS